MTFFCTCDSQPWNYKKVHANGVGLVAVALKIALRRIPNVHRTTS